MPNGIDFTPLVDFTPLDTPGPKKPRRYNNAEALALTSGLYGNPLDGKAPRRPMPVPEVKEDTRTAVGVYTPDSIRAGFDSSLADVGTLAANVAAIPTAGDNAISSKIRRGSEDLRRESEEIMAKDDSLAGKLGYAVGSLPLTVGKYAAATALAPETMGGSVLAMGVVDGMTAANRGLPEMLKAGAKGAVLGKLMGATEKLGLPVRAGLQGGMMGGLTAMEGGGGKDILASTITGAALPVAMHGVGKAMPTREAPKTEVVQATEGEQLPPQVDPVEARRAEMLKEIERLRAENESLGGKPMPQREPASAPAPIVEAKPTPEPAQKPVATSPTEAETAARLAEIEAQWDAADNAPLEPAPQPITPQPKRVRTAEDLAALKPGEEVLVNREKWMVTPEGDLMNQQTGELRRFNKPGRTVPAINPEDRVGTELQAEIPVSQEPSRMPVPAPAVAAEPVQPPTVGSQPPVLAARPEPSQAQPEPVQQPVEAPVQAPESELVGRTFKSPNLGATYEVLADNGKTVKLRVTRRGRSAETDMRLAQFKGIMRGMEDITPVPEEAPQYSPKRQAFEALSDERPDADYWNKPDPKENADLFETLGIKDEREITENLWDIVRHHPEAQQLLADRGAEDVVATAKKGRFGLRDQEHVASEAFDNLFPNEIYRFMKDLYSADSTHPAVENLDGELMTNRRDALRQAIKEVMPEEDIANPHWSENPHEVDRVARIVERKMAEMESHSLDASPVATSEEAPLTSAEVRLSDETAAYRRRQPKFRRQPGRGQRPGANLQLSQQVQPQQTGWVDKARQRIKGKLNDFEDHWLDSTAPIRRLMGEDVWKDVGLLAGAPAKIEGWMKDPDIRFSQNLQAVEAAGLKQQLTQRLFLERAIEVMTNKAGKVDRIGGKNLATVQAELQQLDASLSPRQKAAIKAAQSSLYALMDKSLEMALNGGIISEKQLAGIKGGGNSKYATMLVLEHHLNEFEATAPNAMGQKVGGKANDFKAFSGGTDGEVANVLDATVRQFSRVVGQVERNKVGLKVREMALTDPSVAGMFERFSKSKKYNTSEYGTFDVMVNGQSEKWVTLKPIADVLTRGNEEVMNSVTRTIAAFNNILRQGATSKNVAFFLPNVLRDVMTAFVASEVGFSPVSWLKGFKAAATESGPWIEFMKSGGGMSGYRGANLEAAHDVVGRASIATNRALNPVRWLRNPKLFLDAIERMSQISEDSTRVGVFIRAKDKGFSDRNAAHAARNATADFSKAGVYGRMWNRVIPFFNARVQGSANIVKAFKHNPVKTFATITAAGIAPNVLAWAWNTAQFPDIYDEISEHEKSKNFIWIMGDGRDENGRLTEVVKYPLGEMTSFVNPILFALDGARKDDPKTALAVMAQALSDFLPVNFLENGEFSLNASLNSTLPAIAKGPVEYAFGKNFYTGKPTVPQWMEGASPEQEWDEKTPSALRLAGQASGLSPVRMGQAVRTMGGGVGEQLVGMASGAIDAITGEDTGGGRSALDTVQRRFLGADAKAEDEQNDAALAQAATEAKDAHMPAAREARRVMKEFAKIGDPSSLGDAITNADPETQKEIITRYKRYLGERGRTGFMQRLGNADSSARAVFIHRQLATMDPDAQSDFLAELGQNGILNRETMTELARMYGGL